jgi:hypothetical protein
MTDALVRVNDQLAEAARAREDETFTGFCECGDCLAADVLLTVDGHDEIRDREDLIFADGHEAPLRSRKQNLSVHEPLSPWSRSALVDSLSSMVCASGGEIAIDRQPRGRVAR